MKKEFNILIIFFVLAVTPLAIYFSQQKQTTQQSAHEASPTAAAIPTPLPTMTPIPTITATPSVTSPAGAQTPTTLPISR